MNSNYNGISRKKILKINLNKLFLYKFEIIGFIKLEDNKLIKFKPQILSYIKIK